MGTYHVFERDVDVITHSAAVRGPHLLGIDLGEGVRKHGIRWTTGSARARRKKVSLREEVAGILGAMGIRFFAF